MRQKRVFIALALLLGSAAVIGGVGMLVRQSAVQRQVLPDGSVVTFHGVTLGRDHRLPLGSWWQRVLGRLSPPDLSRRLGVTWLTHTSTNDSLVVWWTLTLSPRALVGSSMPEVILSDDSGTSFLASEAPLYSRVLQSTRGTVFEIVPRGSKRLSVQIRFKDPQTGAVNAAKLNTRNPAGTRESGWLDQSLPATARVGDVEIALTDARCSRLSPDFPSSDYDWTTLTGHFYVGGQSNADWQMVGVEVFDEVGGRYQPRLLSAGLKSSPSQDQLSFVGTLSPKKVWKLRIAACQVGGYASNALWSIRELPLEGLARATFAPRSNILNGVTVVIYDVSMGRPRTLRLATLPPDEEKLVVMTDLTDDRGRTRKVRNPGLKAVQGRRRHGSFDFQLEPDLDVKTVDATIAVAHLRHFELLVRPAASSAGEFRTNGSSVFPNSGD
jgi:hypothetical protein